jgi:tRNA1Val (adenine37-N6)-methyltransferase
MSNPYFKFKQFTIYQDNCAMKVCTDACLFGAWAAKNFEKDQPHKILDIGTGTGLLPLMLAQKLSGAIETIEMEKGAYLQASDNISKSKWKERINLIHADVRQYNFRHPFDLIISNPPFYENDLRTAKPVSNMARHNETLTLEALLLIAALHLSVDGSFAVMVPYYRAAYFISTADDFNLFPFNIAHVKQSTNHSYFRSMIVFKKYPSLNINEKELSIKDGNNYTTDFMELLKDYYR